MSWGGSVAAMIATIKNNRAILGNRRAYFKAKAKLTMASEKLKINFHQATKEELRAVREKVRKQNLIDRLKALIILFIISPFIVFCCYKFWPVIEAELPVNEGKLLMKYYENIKEGDRYLKNMQFDNAIIMYERADEILSKTEVGNYRFALAYTYQCIYQNKGCKDIDWYIHSISKTKHDKLYKALLNSNKLNTTKDTILTSQSENYESVFDQFFEKK